MSDDKISLPIKDVSGKDTGSFYEFAASELADRISRQLLHDAVVMYQANLRQGTHKSKSRAEVSGCKKKLFKQKGTGNARQGNKRQPVRRGGGHAFAKRPKDWSYRLPRKALQLATRMAVLGKIRDKQVVVLSELKIDQPKTRVVASMFKSLGLAGQSCLLAIAQHDAVVWKSARNIPRTGVSPVSDLNAYEILRRRNLVVTRDALDRLRGRAAQ